MFHVLDLSIFFLQCLFILYVIFMVTYKINKRSLLFFSLKTLVYQLASFVYEHKQKPRPCFLSRLRPTWMLDKQAFRRFWFSPLFDLSKRGINQNQPFILKLRLGFKFKRSVRIEPNNLFNPKINIKTKNYLIHLLKKFLKPNTRDQI